MQYDTTTNLGYTPWGEDTLVMFVDRDLPVECESHEAARELFLKPHPVSGRTICDIRCRDGIVATTIEDDTYMIPATLFEPARHGPSWGPGWRGRYPNGPWHGRGDGEMKG